MALHDNIKKARKDKHMTQRVLAEAIGKSHNTISDWEKGIHVPDIDSIMDLCIVLGVDANYMLGWNKENNADDKLMLTKALKDHDFLDENDDLSTEELKKLLDFAKANKDFIINKK